MSWLAMFVKIPSSQGSCMVLAWHVLPRTSIKAVFTISSSGSEPESVQLHLGTPSQSHPVNLSKTSLTGAFAPAKTASP